MLMHWQFGIFAAVSGKGILLGGWLLRCFAFLWVLFGCAVKVPQLIHGL